LRGAHDLGAAWCDMSPRHPYDAGTGRGTRDIDAELARLEAAADALEEALADFEHQLRRIGDGLIRAGGHSRELERQREIVSSNRRRTLADLAANRELRRTMQARRGEIGPGS
jgi:septal ring factor EnvC (AmiA/AmiB activator)